jgi:hypothetical chaperone protein
MRVGLDWGTTNSSAAVYDGAQVRLLAIDPAGVSPSIMRSALFITREGVPFAGREAIDRFTMGNVGRTIDYRWQYIGHAVVTFADVGTVDQALFTQVDANAPGRLFQSLKSHLADAAFTQTNVFGTRYTLEALIAVMLRLIRRRSEAELGGPITGAVVGRPVHYSEQPGLDDLAVGRMRQACELAGLPAIEFLAEPTAAALSYTTALAAERRLLVLDFGGGTFDITVLQTDGRGRVRVLATDGLPVGGDLLDRRIVMGKLLDQFGAGATFGPKRLPLPAALMASLGQWQSIIELNLPRYLKIIEEAVQTGDRPRELRALRALVRQNYGLPLYEAVERAKVRLSREPAAAVTMNVPEIRFSVDLPRWEFDGLIGPDLRAAGACIDRAVTAAGLRRDEVDVVLRTGGSSHIRAYSAMLAAKFGEEKLVEMDAFTGVAAGLAIAARDERLLDQVREAGAVR